MGVLAIIQARMGSSRLPGKSLAPLAGRPLIEHVVNRVRATSLPMDVIVATTDQPGDDVLAAHVESLGVRVYRGSEDDVLARYFGASLLYPDAEVIVRITADDWAKDPELIDTVVGLFLAEWSSGEPGISPPHYMAIGGPSWPVGLDVEVFSRAALVNAHKHATEPHHRAHVTPWIIEHYGAWMLKNPTGKGGAHLRWTVDEIADLSFAIKVYDQLYPVNPLFGFREMIDAGYTS